MFGAHGQDESPAAVCLRPNGHHAASGGGYHDTAEGGVTNELVAALTRLSTCLKLREKPQFVFAAGANVGLRRWSLTALFTARPSYSSGVTEKFKIL